METLFCKSAVEYDVETTGHCDYELMQGLVGMATSLRSARHIIQIVDAREIERNVSARFHKGQISSSILDLWKLDYPAVLDAHVRPHFNPDAASAGHSR